MISKFKGIFFTASRQKSPNSPSILPPLPYLKPFSTSQILGTKMESEAPAPTLLLLAGKSNEEKDVAKILQDNNTLQLHKNGEQVEVVLHSQVQTPFKDDEFRVEEYFYSLSTTRFGRLLIYSPKLSSTHDVISQNNSDLPVGSVCVADVQLKGRGRTCNVWQSPKGCLLFSFSIQMEDGRMVPHLQYVVCLAMTEAIKAICLEKGTPHLDVRIKWPNDLYLGGLKVGGILSTSVYRSKKFYISAGVGLNVGNEKPTTCLNAVLKRVNPLSRELKREDIIAAFFNKFESFYDVFLEQGFQALEELYYTTWLHSGQRVIVQDRSDDQDQLVENVVTIQGLTSSGYLLAITDDGQMCELHPDGNSFDFFKGLIKRKMS
ncbi:Biotin--protein ligase 1, chloroplastic [Capsicum annuum]|uniref:Biotin--protein ligase 1, chloroplastic n=1 Tax=Capsicum annuum TaxID=4072 RepID=A0A1U8EU73_CAPAN|nr:biotin--protein ligase 2 isoform X1 [Capsicum annuum]KAF3683752.1 Biotin--protein ligase 1, chloroplastic [Capsicum annuum]PHT65021.1 Biotin--protein ligase 1, chloroplastic [Capsicum annuum]